MQIDKNGYLFDVRENDIEELENHPETFWEGVKGIEDDAFYGIKKLEKIEIPETVKYIGEDAFRNCSKLKSVVINGAENIEKGAFRNCSKLESISFGDGVKNVGPEVCKNCSKLKSVYLGKDVEVIRYAAFLHCNNLQNVEMATTNLQGIEYSAFEGCGLTYIKLPSSLELIGERAFYGNKNLKTIEFENGVEKIFWEAFANCKQLTEINLPESLETIEKSAFAGCNNLRIIRKYANTEIVHDVLRSVYAPTLYARVINKENTIENQEDEPELE